MRLLLPILLTACAADPEPLTDLPAPALPATLLSYDVDLPDHFLTATIQGFDNTPADNPITDAGATLGRVLFHDRRLSRNGEVACASCHRQDAGFSDPRVKSEGFEGGLTGRHSMPIIELRWYRRGGMFWDERAESLEDQALRPIQDETEMGMTLDELEARLADTEFYPPLFEAAFGDPEITSDRVARALAQFERSIVAYRSPWDEGIAAVDGDLAVDFPNYTAEENLGKQIFFGQHDETTRGLCGSCHMTANPLAFRPPRPGPTFDNTAVFHLPAPANNGLEDADADELKSPSLRNVGLTAPYMHDGRFATLEEVVDYYDHQIVATPNLHPQLRTPDGSPIRLNLSAEDRAALVAFLETLTDPTLATEERWSNPFPRN